MKLRFATQKIVLPYVKGQRCRAGMLTMMMSDGDGVPVAMLVCSRVADHHGRHVACHGDIRGRRTVIAVESR